MTARAAALRALQQLDKGRCERLADELDRLRLPPRERAQAGDLAQGVARNERFLDFVLEQFCVRGLPRDPRVRSALRLGAFQLLFQPSVPARAAVHETVELLGRDRAFGNAVLRRLAEGVVERSADAERAVEVALSTARAVVLPTTRFAKAVDALALRHSLPDAIVARWRAQHGAAGVEQIATAASSEPVLFLRACGGRDALALVEALAKESVACAPTAHPLVVRCKAGAPFGTAAAAAGAFVAQDPTAVRAAEAVAAQSGMTIVDLCAAPGTKATLLAERVQPDGMVFAWDPNEHRRARIAENAERLRLSPWLRVVDSAAALPRADAVLADVPCSNTGVLQRRVEVRRRLCPELFSELAVLQRQILEQAATLVRDGGHVVYSTCSIEPEENERLVAAVASEQRLALVAQATTLPLVGEYDGGYWARLAARSAAQRAADGDAGVPAGAAPR